MFWQDMVLCLAGHVHTALATLLTPHLLQSTLLTISTVLWECTLVQQQPAIKCCCCSEGRPSSHVPPNVHAQPLYALFVKLLFCETDATDLRPAVVSSRWRALRVARKMVGLTSWAGICTGLMQ